MKLSNVAQMRALDEQAITRYGIVDTVLMENAGLGAYDVLKRLGCRDPFVIMCGTGNNGGDGLVVARKLLADGRRVRVRFMGDPGRFAAAARGNYIILQHMGADMAAVEDLSILEQELSSAGLIVDAIFGTGLTREVSGRYAQVIAAINAGPAPVLSLDIPSGIHGDSGQVMGVAVKARATVTFGLPKWGNMLYPGFDHCGALYVTHISFPPAIYAHLRVSTNIPAPLPRRDPAGHKGTFGHGLCIAGSQAYQGAPFLAAYALLKAGGGYSWLAAPRSLSGLLAVSGREIVFAPQEETAEHTMAGSNLPALLTLAQRMRAVVVGPGLSLHAETQGLVMELCQQLDKPLIIDGDGLTALSNDPQVVTQREAPTILTPHLGEMARLTGHSMNAIQAGAIPLLQETARKLSAYVVLKGAHTLVGCPDGQVYVNATGNAGMATAGTGDVLCGAIAALLCQGMPVADAVRTGVYVHGLAGDLAAGELGQDGMVAGDVLRCLPLAMRRLREHYKECCKQSEMCDVV